MKQLSLNITDTFKKELEFLMRHRGISQKAEAIRLVLHEAVERIKDRERKTDFRSWLGAALKGPLNEKSKFKSEDDLWL